jgi:hypothetical protein
MLVIFALNDNGGSESGGEQRVRSVIRTAGLKTYISPVNDPIYYSAEGG